MSDKMRIWDKVSTTDPDHTKEVSFGRKFTAIDAHSQVMEATRMFGPVGEGWGYETEYSYQHLTDGQVLVMCELVLWWNPKESWEGNKIAGGKMKFGPVCGCEFLNKLDSKGKFRPDTDAPKKAMTDALTKALSHLGFNADVFLGMFDNNKYVDSLRKGKAKEAAAAAEDYNTKRTQFISDVTKCKEAADVDTVLEKAEDWMGTLEAGTRVEMEAWARKKQKELKPDGSE